MLGLPIGALDIPWARHPPQLDCISILGGMMMRPGRWNLLSSQVITLCSWVENHCVKMTCLTVTCSNGILSPKENSREKRKEDLKDRLGRES